MRTRRINRRREVIQTNGAFGRGEKARGVDRVFPETGDGAPERLAGVVVGFLRDLFDLLAMQARDTRDMRGMSRCEVVPPVVFFLAIVCRSVVVSLTAVMMVMRMMVMVEMRASR